MITIAQKKDEVFFAGDLNIHILNDLRKKLDSFIDNPQKNLTLNFEDTNSIDMSAIQLLITFIRAYKVKGSLTVSKLNPNISKALKVSGLEKYFK